MRYSNKLRTKMMLLFELLISMLIIACSPTDDISGFDKTRIQIYHTQIEQSVHGWNGYSLNADNYSYLSQSSNSKLKEKLKVCGFGVYDVIEDFPKEVYLGIVSCNKFNLTELKEIASLYKNILDPHYTKIRIYISVTKPSPDNQYSGKENYFIIEYSGKDLKKERVLKSDNPLLPVITWFTSLWPF